MTDSDTQLRAAEPEDAMAVARVHVRSWQAAYRDLLPTDYLDRLRPEERAQRYDFANSDPLQPSTIVATQAGVIRGFATIAAARDADALDHGELCALYVDPECWGHGVGAALVSAARSRLLDLGFGKALLWMLAGNSRAESFYRRDGWASDGLRQTSEIWGATVDKVRYRRALQNL